VRLVLASASPRRAELLRAAGFSFETVVADVDERAHDGENPATYVRRLAADKSAAALAALASTPRVSAGSSLDDIVVLGADTVVVVSRVPRVPRVPSVSGVSGLPGDAGVATFGKPRDDFDAAAMLRRLSGRWHEVMTGVSLRRGAYEVGRVETTRVEFAPLTEADIAWYVASAEGRDKAGAYAIQGLASRFIPRIDGSYANVVGLPVATVYSLLTEQV
jgi:septum formation protein